MDRITEITKRDILNIFQNGLEIDGLGENKTVLYPYFGQLRELDFLKRIYDLKSLPSNDSRCENAEQEILQRMLNNDAYPDCWVFKDKRFNLEDGDDETYLKFLCEAFHPAVRLEKGYWKEFLIEINNLLKNDGYELYPAEKLSNRDVYKWRIYEREEGALFVPYSQRHAKEIKEKKKPLPISRKARNQIYKFLERCNADSMGNNGSVNITEAVFYDLRQFYVPRYYNSEKEYVETDSLQDFIMSNFPSRVLDAIELFARHSVSDDFEAGINAILKLNDIILRLDNGKIVDACDIQITQSSLGAVEEAGLKGLLQEAAKYHDADNMQIAVEKLWDAFERLKTYYHPAMDKKESANKIVNDMANGQEEFRKLFGEEFKKLTAIGNEFRIRHHEADKCDIQDERHFEYFYKRCLLLILTAKDYLEGRGL